MAAHRAWRVHYSARGAGAASCATLQLRGTTGGPDLTQGATGAAIGSTYYGGSYEYDKAFDNNDTTFWASNGGSGQEAIGWDFGAGNSQDIVEFSYLIRPDSYGPPQAPTNGYLEYTDGDPAGSPVWSRLFDFGPTSGWTAGVPQVFDIPPPAAHGIVSETALIALAEGNPRARLAEQALIAIVTKMPDTAGHATASELALIAICHPPWYYAPRLYGALNCG